MKRAAAVVVLVVLGVAWCVGTVAAIVVAVRARPDTGSQLAAGMGATFGVLGVVAGGCALGSWAVLVLTTRGEKR